MGPCRGEEPHTHAFRKRLRSGAPMRHTKNHGVGIGIAAAPASKIIASPEKFCHNIYVCVYRSVQPVVISIQGITSTKYQEIANVNISIQRILDNIKYFHDNKSERVQLYVKIVDSALDKQADAQKFYDMFGNICDSMSVEHTSPIYPGVAVNTELEKKEITQFGLGIRQHGMCSQPFYTMQVNPDGKVVPSYSIVYPEIIGDVNKQSLKEIWNGDVLKQFRLNMLKGDLCQVCQDCLINKYRFFPEDDLSGHEERLIKIYNL